MYTQFGIDNYKLNRNVRVIMDFDKSAIYEHLQGLFPNYLIFPSIPIIIYLQGHVKQEFMNQLSNKQRSWLFMVSCHFVITDLDYFPLMLIDTGVTFTNRTPDYSLFRKQVIDLTQLPYYSYLEDRDTIIEQAQFISNASCNSELKSESDI